MNKPLKIALATALLLPFLATPAHAHDHFTLDERYEFTVGWMEEPAFVDAPNGVEIKIVDKAAAAHDDHGHDHGDESGDHGHDAGTPFKGAEETLKVEVSTGGKSKVFDLDDRWGEPGWYQAEFIPTVAGTYTFRIFGTVNGTEIDKTIDYAKNPILASEESRWPEATPSTFEVQQKLADLETQVADLEAQIASLEAQGATSPDEAQANAPGAGVLGALAALGGIALVAARRRRS